jgi:hypothetical protein
MNLEVVMNLPVRQQLVVGRLAAAIWRKEDEPGFTRHLEYQFMRREVRLARVELDKEFEERSWALTLGIITGEWFACAAGHEAYSEDPAGDGWISERLLGGGFWLCSHACRVKWRDRETKKLETENSKRVELTYEGGKKSVMRTAGRTLDGKPALATVEKV